MPPSPPPAASHGHGHNYPRFLRDYGDGVSMPFIIAGAGGYAINERAPHKLQQGLGEAKLPYATAQEGVTLAGHDERDSGFLRIPPTPAISRSIIFPCRPTTFWWCRLPSADSVTVPATGDDNSA